MTMYDFLKSTAVLAGLATGSAAIATTLNGIGSYFDFGGVKSSVAGASDSQGSGRAVFAAAEGGQTRSILGPLEVAPATAGGLTPPPALHVVSSEPAPAEYNLALFDERRGPGVSLGMTLRGLAPGGGASVPATVRAAADGAASGPAPMAFGNLSPLGSTGSASGEPGVLALADTGDEDEGEGADTSLQNGIAPVPVPAGGALLLSGLIGLGLARRRRG